MSGKTRAKIGAIWHVGVGSPNMWFDDSCNIETQDSRIWGGRCFEAQGGGHANFKFFH